MEGDSVAECVPIIHEVLGSISNTENTGQKTQSRGDMGTEL